MSTSHRALPLRRCVRLGLGLLGVALTLPAAMAQSPAINSLSSARQTVAIGQTLTLSASASGATSYQWKRNGRTMPGATLASYSIVSASPPRDNGWYQVVATNASGSTPSATIFVNVTVPVTQALGWGFAPFLYPPALANVSALALTEVHGMAVLADGSLFRWGGLDLPESAPPSGLSGLVAVAGSWQHSLALKSDGTVVAWGLYQHEFVAAPGGPVAGLTNVVAISDAMFHSMALRRDGTVAVWTSGTLPADLAVPAGLANVISVSAGARYCLAAKADGTLVGWGSAGTPGVVVPAGLTGVVSVHAGTSVAAALKSDGTVVTWSPGFSSAYEPPSGLSGVVALAAGEGHFYALKNDGRTAFWGVVMRWGLASVSPEFTNVQLLASSQFNVVGVAHGAGLAAPAITTQPTTVSPGLGATVTFRVAATGATPLSFQWQRRAAGAADFGDVIALGDQLQDLALALG